MAIAKEIWDKAKFLFELNKSLNEIEAETGINRTSVGKKANKDIMEKEGLVKFSKKLKTVSVKIINPEGLYKKLA